jgi:hypothetical protein
VSVDTIRDGLRVRVPDPPLSPSVPDHSTKSFSAYISRQPEHLSTLFPRWRFIAKLIQEFYHLISDLSQVLVATDGGATDDYGSFGWVIALKSGQRLAQGQGITFGYDPRSYRAENYGCKAAHTFIQLACKFLHRPIPPGTLPLP